MDIRGQFLFSKSILHSVLDSGQTDPQVSNIYNGDVLFNYIMGVFISIAV